MPGKMFEKFRHLFEPKERSSEPAGDIERIHYPMPEPEKYDFYYLDPLSKRKMTICNLFANHHKTVAEICSLLETSRKLVIDTLIENKLLKERRKATRPHTPAPEEIRMK